MRFHKLLSAAAVLGLSFFLLGADEKVAKCPVSGKPASKDHTLNINGKSVGFCCGDCKASYKKDLNVSAEKSEKCPMSGEATKAETAILEKSAELVHFCCDKCPKAFAEKNKLEVKDAGPKNCPVSGKPAVKDQSVVVNGKSVYFCCGDCKKGYLKGLGIAADAAVGNCPISSKPGKAETAQILVKSKEVSFCCNKCQKAYLEKNFKDGVKVAAATK